MIHSAAVDTQAAIERAYFRRTDGLSKGAGSKLVGELLSETVGPWVCMTEVRRPEGRFTLVLDADWAEIGVQLMGLCHDTPEDLVDMELPRPALRAVVEGWPSDWDGVPSPTLEVHMSPDLVPHISLSGSSRLVDSGG